MPAAYGIIGYPLSHSFSPAYFAKKFAALGINANYTAYTLKDISKFPELLQTFPKLQGLNVTIPHKQAVMYYVDELDEVAKDIGAVNCLAINGDHVKGYNTDAIGFERSLTPLLQQQHTHALILGTGGSSKAVAYALSKLGIRYTKVSRTPDKTMLGYDKVNSRIMEQHKLIINTTSQGMYPLVETFPDIPYKLLDGSYLLYDLVYNPAETKFLSLGKAEGAAIKNGYEMLQLQAEASWEIWSHRRS